MPKHDQSLPQSVLDAAGYVLLPEAKNSSRDGTLRAARWPVICKYSGVDGGIELAKREAGVTKRHLHQLERNGYLRFMPPVQASISPASKQAVPTPNGHVSAERSADPVAPVKTAPPMLTTNSTTGKWNPDMHSAAANSVQTVQSQDVSIAQVLQAFYVVPTYQREYVWEPEQVEQLLSDILLEHNSSDHVSEYFIGSIVVCPGEGGTLELIDGQQRLTTIYVALCAIRDHVLAAGQQPPGALHAQLSATSTDVNGLDSFRHRLELQYPDSGDVLSKLAISEPVGTELRQKTRSMDNILGAYKTVRRFLAQEFSDLESVRRFYGYFTNRVKLIRIETQDVARALKVFETINDRGVGLDSMDLLKNLLFMRASRAQFDELKGLWKGLQDTIYGIGEKPLRFLRYYVISSYDIDELREDQIYGWMSKNEEVCGYSRDPLGFARNLLAAAKAYTNFIRGCDQHGEAHPGLKSLQYLGGRLRMHLILLLAGRHLPDKLFVRVVREIEDLFFCFLITREHTRTIDNHLAKWAKGLRKVDSEATLEDFLATSLVKQREAMAVRFDEEMSRLSADVVAKYRLMYVLAKLSQQLELDAYGETEGTRWLDRFTSGGYEIEHIYPRSPTASVHDESGVASPEIVESLGNLVLVEKSINASLGNRPYSEKRPVYQQSQLLLTRSLSERPRVGQNTRIDVAVAGLPSFKHWSQEEMRRRHAYLVELARRVWSVPEPKIRTAAVA
ncbi:MAG: DUF262 domain-containing protein [Pseudomonadota bacterium]